MDYGPSPVHTYSPCEWLDLQYAAHTPLNAVTLRKKLRAGPLCASFSASWDLVKQQPSLKASLKERLFGGRFHLLASERALEYRKRIVWWGLAQTHVYARWSLDPDHRRLVPQIGVGLDLSGGERLMRPLSVEMKPKLPLGHGLKFKAHTVCSVRLPVNISLLRNQGDDEDDDGGTNAKLRVRLQALELIMDI